MALGVVADRGGRAAAGSEHPFEFRFAQLRRAPEVVDDLDDPAADHDVAHELGHPRVDLGVLLARRAGSGTRSRRWTGRWRPRNLLESVVGSRMPHAGGQLAPVAPPARSRASPAERRPRALGPVVEQLGQPAPEAARAAADPGSRRPCAQERVGGARRQGVDGLAVRAALGRDRRADPDPDASPEAEPAGAVDRDRDDRDAGPQREVGRAVGERQQLALAAVDPPLPRDHDRPSRPSSTRWTRRVVSIMSVFSGRYGIAEAGPHDQPVARARAPCPPPWARTSRPSGLPGSTASSTSGSAPVEVVEHVDRRARARGGRGPRRARGAALRTRTCRGRAA